MRQCAVVKLTLLRQVLISPTAATSILAAQRQKSQSADTATQEIQVYSNILSEQQRQLQYQILVLKCLHSHRMPDQMVGLRMLRNERRSTMHWACK